MAAVKEHSKEKDPGRNFSAGKFPGKEAGALLLTLAAALALWFVIASRSQRRAVEEIGRDLVTINAHKAAQVSDWRGHHYREAVQFSRDPILRGIVLEELSSPGSKRGQLDAWLKDTLLQQRYASLAFQSPEGALIAATPGYRAGAEKTFTEALAEAARKGTPLLTDLYLAADGRPRLTMLSPISAGGARGAGTRCVLVINTDPETEFYPLLKAAPLFFDTAETLLVRKEGGEVLFLNELEYRQGTALKLKHPLSDMKLPAAKAVREGYSGFFEGEDYRGVKVFSAMRPVEGSNWAVVTKLDRAALLAPVKSREHLRLALILLGAGALYGAAHLFLLSRERAGLKKIREGEERYRTILHTTMDGFWLADPQGRLLEVNEAYCGLSGYSAAELPGMRVSDLETPETAAAAAARLGRIAEQGAGRFETRHRRKDGSEFDVEISVRYQQAGGGRFVCFLRDITASKRAQAYGEMARQVLQILNEPGEGKDTIRRVIEVLKEGTGFSVVGIRLQDGEDYPYLLQKGFSPDFVAAENSLVERGADGGVCRDKSGKPKLECTCGLVISGRTEPANPLYTQGGSFWTGDSLPMLDLPPEKDPRHNPRNRCMREGYASMALVPIRDNEKIVGLLQLNDKRKGGLSLDRVELLEGIAAQIGAALMRKRADETIKEAAQIKSKFASMVSHELRSPLTSIMLGVGLVLEETAGLSGHNKTLLKLAYDNATRLGRLINNVLDFQKIAAGKMTFDLVENDLRALVRTTVSSMHLMAKKKGLELTVEMNEALPPALFDKDMIVQVLTNLLANAIAHTEKGTIALHAGREGESLHVAVRDTGPGIKAANLPKLFQPFEQLDNGKDRKTGGTGLGLAISKEIIAGHKGKIWAESEPGVGSVFHFTLPLGKGAGE